MILVSPTNEPIENLLVIGIGLVYIAFVVGYIWYHNRKEK
jgi:hypothetical protein